MKIVITSLLIFSGFMGLSSGLLAQTPDELLNIAVASNPGLKVLKKSYQAALEKAPQLSQLPNPEIGFGVYLLPVETRLGPQRARVSVTQMFPWFGTLQAQEDWAATEARATFERIAALELELRDDIRQAYFSLYELSASQTIIQDRLEILESLKSVAEAKVSSGKASLADVLRLDLQLDELSQKLLVLENRQRIPRARINQILYRQTDTPILLPDSLPFAEIAIPRDSLIARIYASHPMVRMYELQQQAATAAIRVNELQGMPGFGIGADYLNTGTRSDAFPENNGRDAVQIRATISIPMYREKFNAREREERFRIEGIEAQKQQVLSGFEAQIEMAYAEFDEARLEVALTQRQIQTIQSAIAILEADYLGQSQSFDELLQLELSSLEYELQYLQAVVRSHQAKSSIERYLPF